MPINSQTILQWIQQNKTNRTRVSNHGKVKGFLDITYQDSTQLLENEPVNKILPYILWNDTWNKYGTFGTTRKSARTLDSNKRYSRGRKVFVDLGYNIGKEASMSHPAIVVANFDDFLIVVPHTSDEGKVFSKDIERSIIRCPADGTVFPKDTILTIHQARCIDKNRVIKDLGVSASNYILPDWLVDEMNQQFKADILPYDVDLLKALEAKLAFHYTPDVFIKMRNFKQQLESLQQENEELKAKLEAIELPFFEAATDLQK